MIFFCYIETGASTVPHMEPMPVETLEQARFYAQRLMRDHARPVAAHIFRDDERLDTVVPRRGPLGSVKASSGGLSLGALMTASPSIDTAPQADEI